MTLAADKIKTRDQVSPEDTWNVEAMYPSLELWEKAFAEIEGEKKAPRWPVLASYKGRLGEGSSIVREVFELVFSLSRELEKLYTYAHLRHDEEITLDAHKAMHQRITSLLHYFEQESSWVSPELLSLPEKTLAQYLASPELASYRFHLEKIVRLRPHTLSADKEELLAMAGKAFETAPKAFSALNNADLKFGSVKDSEGKEHPLSHSLYQLYLRHPDRKLRENAFKTMHGTYSGFENTLCELIQGEIQSHIFNARARNYSSSLEAALFPKNIPLSVYHSLIKAVREELPSLHRYVGLRKKILNVSELHLWDLYVPLVPKVDIKMNYSESEAIVIESAAPLGKEYQSLLRKGLTEEKWVDRFENRNKRSGAYSSGCYDSFPYILMNFQGILRDTFTLAHEAGHSMHSLLSRMSQPYHYSHYPIFVAEVASTFNEELLMTLLLKTTTDPRERLFLVNEKIEEIRTTLFRQTLFAEFELLVHDLAEKNVPLTPALLKEEYRKLNAAYFGPEAVIDDAIDIEWARIPHFYYNFYVFQYATGISAALALAERVLTGDERARGAFLSFLKGGGSGFPIELLQVAGVDVTTVTPVKQAIKRFDTLLSELEKLI